MNRIEKRAIQKYLLGLNVFQKKQILLKVIEKNTNYSKEEKTELILKIDKMSADEVEQTIKELIDFYGWVYGANAYSINWMYTWFYRYVFNI